ncbi:DMT family transporter [Nocardioides antri]|uniref:DMT family transporter n=1 Tax=Nocardioides antri TaxID=2607659 RepID=UPI002482AE09|nr:DMT family transporter [Nocardioides antri]
MSADPAVEHGHQGEPPTVGARGSVRVWAGVALVLLSTVIYGSTPALVTFVRGDVSVVDLIAYRAALAALMFLALARLVGVWSGRRRLRSASRPVRAVLVGASLWGPQFLLYYASFEYIDTSLAVAIGFVYPTVVLILVAATERQRPAPVEIALSLLALLGIAALLLPGGDAGVHPLGVCLALLAACGYAVYVLLADRLLQDVEPFELGAQISLGATICAVAVGLVLQRMSVLTDPRDLVVVGAQAVLMVVATGCYYGGLMRLGSSQASLVDTAQPVVALAAGGLLLGESMVAVQVAGVVVVTASVALSSVLTHRRATVPYADPP